MSKGSSRGNTWNEVRATVLVRDNNTCMYCGSQATEVDHVIPKALGGTDTLDNLVAACKACNSKKQDKLLTRTHWVNPKYR